MTILKIQQALVVVNQTINQTSIPKDDLHELNLFGLTGLQIKYYLWSFQEKDGKKN